MGYTVKFDTRKNKNLRIDARGTALLEFVIKEVDGVDEEAAANFAKARGGSANVTEELVRAGIVSVNGQAVQQPYLAFDAWSVRARGFVFQAFKSVNGTEDKEMEDFIAAAVPNGESQPQLVAAPSATG